MLEKKPSPWNATFQCYEDGSPGIPPTEINQKNKKSNSDFWSFVFWFLVGVVSVLIFKLFK